LTKRALSNELEDLKIFRTVVLLVSFMEVDPQVNFASNDSFFPLPRFKGEPTIVRVLVLYEIGAEPDMAQEGLTIGSIVNRDVNFRVITNHITVLN
jgi:hypothetical protein